MDTTEDSCAGGPRYVVLNGNSQPCLIVNDLKLGAAGSDSIGLWVDFGTEGFFTDITIHPAK